MVAGVFERGEIPQGDWKNYPIDKIDLYFDGEQIQEPICLDYGKTSFEFQNLPSGDKLIELWLPQYAQFRLRLLELTSGATVTPHLDTRPRWLTYGSSITHSKYAESPSKTWPAIVARKHGLDLTNLGFAGNCFLQPEVAHLIAGMPAHFISMKIGINIYLMDGHHMTSSEFKQAIIKFIGIVRDGQPDTPLAVISPIHEPFETNGGDTAKFTLQGMRDVVKDTVEKIQRGGDGNIHYINGPDLMGKGTDDQYEEQYHIHPNAEGNKTLAKNFLEKVAIPLFTEAE
jgi:hypothetical protein